MNTPTEHRRQEHADYVRQVATHLRARGRARTRALDDLREALAETPDPESFGPAATYARSVDEELGTGRFLSTILGIPNSLAPGVLDRLAQTFDPADERLVVPHVLGIGWAINVGRLAVRLGLLNPDDLDDEVLARATHGPGRVVRWATYGTATAAGVRALRQASPSVGAAAIASAAVAALAEDRALPPRQRLTLAATGLGIAAAGLGLPVRDGSQRTTTTALGWAIVVWCAATYLPVRVQINRETVRSATA